LLKKTQLRTKHEVDRMTRCWVMAIWSFHTWAGHRSSDMRHRTSEMQVILYSVQCCYAVHWTDNKISSSSSSSSASKSDYGVLFVYFTYHTN